MLPFLAKLRDVNSSAQHSHMKYSNILNSKYQLAVCFTAVLDNISDVFIIWYVNLQVTKILTDGQYVMLL